MTRSSSAFEVGIGFDRKRLNLNNPTFRYNLQYYEPNEQFAGKGLIVIVVIEIQDLAGYLGHMILLPPSIAIV